jgi:hypothetical protein
VASLPFLEKLNAISNLHVLFWINTNFPSSIPTARCSWWRTFSSFFGDLRTVAINALKNSQLHRAHFHGVTKIAVKETFLASAVGFLASAVRPFPYGEAM